jgi:hypothetical protein
MPKFPVIQTTDWVSLHFVEAETREEALIKAATAWVEAISENCEPDELPVLDPLGVRGRCEPNATLKVLYREYILDPRWSKDNKCPQGQKLQILGDYITESEWVSPIYEGD